MDEPTWKPTACILCECNCGIEVQLGGEDGRELVRFRGDKRHPTSKGYACEKPHRLNFYQNPRDRLTQPLRRRSDGSFEEISWDVAIREVAARLGRVRDQHGGASIFYYGGGGQGNHLPGAYATSTRRALGMRYRSSALAQEKTGEFWIADRMLGAMTRSDFEHCDVALFLGKNPWQSHSIPRARVTLKELAKDPRRTLIVIDPRRTETAAMADLHLQVRPGCDAWLLTAMLRVMIEEGLVDQEFVDAQTTGAAAVVAALEGVDVADYAARAGVPEAQVRQAARSIAGAEAFASFEDLGVQMNRHSTLVSYLHRLLWLLTGNFGKPGTHFTPQPMVPFATGATGRKSPVVGAPIISGMVPCNVIAEEILTDHEDRYRAMIVEAANPAHSLAESKRMGEALRALDTLVVIDVVMSETARLADYVLPASTQFEKAEATFFNFEFPDNYFQLRRALLPALAGQLPEAEMHARLCEALGVIPPTALAPLHAAAKEGLGAYGAAFMQHVLGDPALAGYAAVILYRTLGPVLPEGTAEGAVLLGLCLRCAMQHGPAMARAGFDGPPPVAAMKLFEAITTTPTGVTFAKGSWDAVRPATSDGRAHLDLPDMLEEVEKLVAPEAEGDSASYPFVLSAGERRSFTANTIIRDPAWRKKDAGGALRMCPTDADRVGVVDGGRARLRTARGSAVVTVEVTDTMQPGHVSLPNGHGVTHSDDGAGQPERGGPGRGSPGDATDGVSPNELTDLSSRDPFAGTPWHKFVRAHIEALG